MKAFFRAIGGFFARIWRWIKETAWVQPLLIVSLIFGVILLIQPISNGIIALGDAITNNKKYYTNNKVTLYGNEAYDLLYDENTKFAKDDKYFLVFVGSDCTYCENAYPGFKKLFEDSTFKSDYKLKTIYIDEEGKDADIEKKEGLLYELFYRPTDDTEKFHNAIYEALYDPEYRSELGEATEEELEYINDMREGLDLYTPLILLMDKETYEADEKTLGIKEAMIGLKGWDNSDEPIKLAETLDRMWLSSWGSEYNLGK